MTRIDKFSYIKNPSQLFNANNLNGNYLTNLMANFDQDHKLRTLYLPLENSTNEIDDELFEQYHHKHVKYKSATNSNFLRLFITINFQRALSFAAKPGFKFELNFITNRILITNEDNFTKLILNLLNVLSLWLNLCILDLHVYVYYAYFKIVFIFMFTYRLLIRIDSLLFRFVYYN